MPPSTLSYKDIKPISSKSSSERLVAFLEKERLHKKDFASMIGVTLSYVYNLMDHTTQFSSRQSTLERIAVVMESSANDFKEYKGSRSLKSNDPGVQFLQQQQEKLGLSNLELLKKLPKNMRLFVVDLWRGAEAFPLDWAKLTRLCQVLEINAVDVYPYWQNRLQQYLMDGGWDPVQNLELTTSIFEGVRQHLLPEKRGS